MRIMNFLSPLAASIGLTVSFSLATQAQMPGNPEALFNPPCSAHRPHNYRIEVDSEIGPSGQTIKLRKIKPSVLKDIANDYHQDATFECMQTPAALAEMMKNIRRDQEDYVRRTFNEAGLKNKSDLEVSVKNLVDEMNDDSPITGVQSYSITEGSLAQKGAPAMEYEGVDYAIKQCVVAMPDEDFSARQFLQSLATETAANTKYFKVKPGKNEELRKKSLMIFIEAHEKGHCLGLGEAGAERKAFEALYDTDIETTCDIMAARTISLIFSTSKRHGLPIYYEIKEAYAEKTGQKVHIAKITDTQLGDLKKIIKDIYLEMPYKRMLSRLELLGNFGTDPFNKLSLTEGQRQIIRDIVVAMKRVGEPGFNNKKSPEIESIILSIG